MGSKGYQILLSESLWFVLTTVLMVADTDECLLFNVQVLFKPYHNPTDIGNVVPILQLRKPRLKVNIIYPKLLTSRKESWLLFKSRFKLLTMNS
jgi:hypothetical protein